MREIWFAVLIGLALASAVPAIAAPPPPAKANAEGALALTPSDRILGNPSAPITIVEYASLSCPHCAHFATTVLPTIKKEWIDTGKAKLAFRDFPLDKEALVAEMVARCAPRDRYFTVVDGLFRAQIEWVTAKDWQAALRQVSRLLGVSGKQFDACLANKKLENEIVQSRLTASQKLRVDATPTFFVNGKKFEGEPTVAAFDKLLSGLAAKEKS